MKNITSYGTPYELSVKLKEKHFNEPCIFVYLTNESNNEGKIITALETLCSNNPEFDSDGYKNIDTVINSELLPQYVSIPLFEQVFDWLDKTHKIRISLGTSKTSGKYRFDILQFTEDKWQGDYNLTSFYNSRDRNIKAIEMALELI